MGTITLLRDELKRTIRRTSEKLATFKSEAERLEGLENWFGVKLKEY